MVSVIEGTTVDHYPRVIDWTKGTGVSRCGRSGEVFTKDGIDLCQRCADELPPKIKEALDGEQTDG